MRRRLPTTLVAPGCGNPSSGSSSFSCGSRKIDLVGYSTPQEAYEAIIPAFEKTPAGFARSKTAQQIFADHGYRPVLKGIRPAQGISFPTPKTLYTIDDLGGWSKANADLFDPDKGYLAKVFQDIGAPTG